MPRRGYTELYEAVQDAFEPEDMTQDRLEQWLYHGERRLHSVKWGKDRKGGQRYRDVKGKPISAKTTALASKLSETKDIVSEIPDYDVTNIGGLRGLRNRANALDVHRDAVVDEIDVQLGVLEEEERIAGEVDKLRVEVEEIEDLPVEEQKRLYKEGTREERLLASVALREEHPRILGGLVSGESRQKRRQFKLIFD